MKFNYQQKLIILVVSVLSLLIFGLSYDMAPMIEEPNRYIITFFGFHITPVMKRENFFIVFINFRIYLIFALVLVGLILYKLAGDKVAEKQ